LAQRFIKSPKADKFDNIFNELHLQTEISIGLV